MKERQAFGLSILVALSLHAAILAVPRIAGGRGPEPPGIEVSLDSLTDPGTDAAQPVAASSEGAGPVSPPGMRAASPSAAAVRPTGTPAVVDSQKEPPPAASERAEPASQSPAPASAPGGSAIPVASFGGPRGGTGAPGEATPGSAGPTTQAPRLRGEMLPAYPRSAKKAGIEGVVTISAFIDETGRVVSAVILDSSGHQSLDTAALEWVKRARFDPAVREARPVSSPLIIPVRFKLN